MAETKRCSICKFTKSLDEFYKGDSSHCIPCTKARLRERYKNESPEQRERRRIYGRQYMRKKSEEINQDPKKKLAKLAKSRECRARNQVKCLALLREFKGRGCCVCGEMEYCCIDAHHVDPSQKEYAIGQLVLSGMKLARFSCELAKCIPICANCHRKFHASVEPIPELVNLAVQVRNSADGELNRQAA